MDTRDLQVRFTADTSQLKQGLQDIGSATNTSNDNFGKLIKTVAAGAVVFGAATRVGNEMQSFLKDTVKSAQDSEIALSQLDAVLTSTGGAAGVTRDQAVRLSKALEGTTSMSDEAVLATENMLLTFTNISKDGFEPATRAAIDMATAMNHGMRPTLEQSADAAKLLGKALQDPDAGLGALKRVGVNVDELKKKFTDSMTVQEKQKLIIQEIGTEFGGSATNHLKTFSGQLEHMQEKWDDLKETIGGVLIRALTPLLEKVTPIIDKIAEFTEKHKTLTQAIVLGAAAVAALLPVMGVLAATFLIVATVGGTVAATIALIAFGIPILIGLLVGGAVMIVTHWGQVKTFFEGLGRTLGGFFEGLGKAVVHKTGEAGTAIHNFVTGSQRAFGQFVASIGKAVTDAGLWINHWPEHLGSALGRAAKLLVDFTVKTIPEFIHGITIWFSMLPGRVSSILSQMVSAISSWFASAYSTSVGWASRTINDVTSWFNSLPGRVAGAVAGASHAANSWMGNLYSGVVSWAARAVNDIVSWFNGLPGRIAGAISNAVGAATRGMGELAGRVSSSFNKAFKGHALGGSVGGGTPIVVGERGQEVFVPFSSGHIVPANSTGGGGQTVSINIYGNFNGVRDLQQVGDTLADRLRLAQRGL